MGFLNGSRALPLKKRDTDMRRTILCIGVAAALSLGLGGCAGGGLQIGGSGSGLSDVVTFTDTDLQNAENIAVANSDTIAQPCFPALQKWVDSFPGAGSGVTISGVASGFEMARVTVNGVQSGFPQAVIVACGPLYMQTHGQFLQAISAGTALLKG